MISKFVLILLLTLTLNNIFGEEYKEINAQVISEGTDLKSKPVETSLYTGRVYSSSKINVIKRTSWKDEINGEIDYWYFVRKRNTKGWILEKI